MRIAVLAKTFPKPSETFVLRQVIGLLERGHDVEVFALEQGPLDALPPEAAVHRLEERIVRVAEPPDGAARLSDALRLLRRRAWRHPLALLRCLNVFRLGLGALGLEPLLRGAPFVGRPEYDAVLCHFGTMGRRFVALREAGVLGGRFVTVFHGHDLTRYVARKGPGAYSELMRAGDLFVPVSETFAERLRELGADAERVVVHHMGVDTKRIAFGSRELPADGPLRVLSVGRLVEKKGFDDGIRAIAELVSRGQRPVEYRIVGDGPLRAELEALADALLPPRTVRFLGWQEPEQVQELMHGSHVLLLPSRTGSDGDQEGIPVTAMEAMAAGLPVVGTRHSGIHELVRDGECGFLVPEHSPRELAACLEHLAASPALYAEFARAGRRIVEEGFDSDRLDDRLVELLESGPEEETRAC